MCRYGNRDLIVYYSEGQENINEKSIAYCS